MIKYNLIPRKSPKDKSVKYYASPVQSPVDREEFIEAIAMESTVTRHDVVAVLSALQQHIASSLREGKSVRLCDLGSFHITLKTKGVKPEQKDRFDSSNIKNVMCRFYPGKALKYGLSLQNPKVRFSRVGEAEATSGE